MKKLQPTAVTLLVAQINNVKQAMEITSATKVFVDYLQIQPTAAAKIQQQDSSTATALVKQMNNVLKQTAITFVQLATVDLIAILETQVVIQLLKPK